MKRSLRVKAIFAGVLALAAATHIAGARFINSRSFRELDQKSDIIVVARLLSTKDTAEETTLPGISPATQVVGVSSQFKVVFVLKGDSRVKKLTVHHYRLAKQHEQSTNSPVFIDGPNLVSFNPEEPALYLLFLQYEADGRDAPFDQVDPALTSIFKLNGPGWGRMQAKDFRAWLDAQKWLNDPRPPGWMDLSPEISPEGRADGSLHEAAFNGKLEKAEALLEADPKFVNSHASYAEQTPLHLAAEYGHKDVAVLLLKDKADIEAKAYGGWTPLLNAVFGGHKDMVELLLTHKANVAAKDNWGRTPLHVAAENGCVEIAALLLANKADVNAKNNDGRTPLAIALLNHNNELAGLLRRHGGRNE